MVAAHIRALRITRKQTLLSVLGGVVLVTAAVGIRVKLDTASPTPAVAAPAALVPLYVLPPQPAELITAGFVATPEPQYEDWQVTLLAARHPEP